MAGPAGPAIAVSGAVAPPLSSGARATSTGGPGAVVQRAGSRHIGQNGVPSGRWKGSATW
ncbi:hypothetical protein DER29_0233 [Micromonospora sp. M71_S20]|nr:hypothetical protein DER29_0233 [Micromonospora sp. M71_S20]